MWIGNIVSSDTVQCEIHRSESSVRWRTDTAANMVKNRCCKDRQSLPLRVRRNLIEESLLKKFEPLLCRFDHDGRSLGAADAFELWAWTVANAQKVGARRCYAMAQSADHLEA